MDIEASNKMIELLKKYDRFETTVTGVYKDFATERLLKMDERVCAFCTELDIIKT